MIVLYGQSLLHRIFTGKVSWLPIVPRKLQNFSTLYNLQYTVFSSAWTCSLWFNLFGMLVFLISQPYTHVLQRNLYYPLPYAYSTNTAIYRLIVLHNVTAEHTSHTRVKDSVTHKSTIILSSNFKGRLIH